MRDARDCSYDVLSDEVEWSVTLCVSGVNAHTRHVEILRRSAERSMVAIVRAMSGRLKDLNPSVEEDKLQKVRMTVTTEPAPTADTTSEALSDAQTESTVVPPPPEIDQTPMSAVSEGQIFVAC
jgi:hypothetical protein